MARVLVLDVQAQSLRVTDCSELKEMYELIGCDYIDIATRVVGGRNIDIIIDDFGALKEDKIVSAVNKNMRAMLFGNLIFAKHDNVGEQVDLDWSDIAQILKSLVVIATPDRPGGYIAIRCEYCTRA